MQNFILYTKQGNIPLVSRDYASCVESAALKQELNGTDSVTINLTSAKIINFSVGDYILIYGNKYQINNLPNVTKKGFREFSYQITFEGLQYAMIDVLFFLKDNIGNEYYNATLTANLSTFLDNIVWNLNRIYGEFTWVSECFIPESGQAYITSDYSNQNCLQVLQDLCNRYNAKFRIKVENGVNKIEVLDNSTAPTSNFHFKYGKGNGLYEIERKNIDSKNIITRLYAYGSSENLGGDYKDKNLCLPINQGQLSHKSTAQSYIQTSDELIALLGIKENTATFDIKPQAEFTIQSDDVQGIDPSNHNRFTILLPFDLKEKDASGSTKYLIEGNEAKITFQNGNLGGYEFAILDKTTTQSSGGQFLTDFWLKKIEDENGFIIPNDDTAAFQFAEGDSFIITGINVPDQYKIDAQDNLLQAATEYLEEYSIPQVMYSVDIDYFYIKRKIEDEGYPMNPFTCGDSVLISDNDLGIESRQILITAIERNLITDYDFKLTLGESTAPNTLVRIIGDIGSLKKSTEYLDVMSENNQRINYQAQRQFKSMVFDSELDENGQPYFGDHIKPLSIETKHLSVGAKWEQFTLQNFNFEPNYNVGGDYSQYYSYNFGNQSNAKLTHQTILDTSGNMRVWNIAPIESPYYRQYPTSSNGLYIYAICPKASNINAQILVSDSQYSVESENSYYLLIGMVSSKISEHR